uniref:galactose-specific lectin nattectin-like n=1 Tax=Scatophagus argus TaxID=75038 RepID=UPI001ED8442F|nr:galactose-specific lectin nattectin-like [Scatophagus argus]XP_046254128.1 galactose-specific lectin nattectin-like [Scatophagus argus]
MTSGFRFIAVLSLTSGLWMGANTECQTKTEDCCKPCPSGWTQFGSRCFMFNYAEKDWADAEMFCIGLGGNLASLKAAEDYTFLRDIVKKSTGSDKSTWIGGFDAVKEGVWQWSDGSKFVFKGWYLGEPNNTDKAEHCMEINFEGQDYVNDMKCNEKKSFICAFDL